jgi:hypothetical protein
MTLDDSKHWSLDTLLAHTGRTPGEHKGAVNPPVYHASTVLFPTVTALEESVRKRNDPGHFHYGRFGTPTSHALEQALARLEGGDHALVLPSGVAAISTTLLAHCGPGDHLLMVDSVYGPARSLCETLLRRLGIETEYYDPRIGAGIARLIRPNTKLVYLESPGSLTFEIQDLPAIAEPAHRQGVAVAIDSTWGTPLFHTPLALGADLVIHAATKYIVGHADAMLGAVVMRKDRYLPVRLAATALGHTVAADDCYLALRGPANAFGTAAAPPGDRPDPGQVAAREAGGRPRHPPRPARPPRPCPVAARLPRRSGAVRGGAETLLPARGRGDAQRPQAVRHGLLLGRLRKPGAADRPLASARRGTVARRSGTALAHPCRA